MNPASVRGTFGARVLAATAVLLWVAVPAALASDDDGLRLRLSNEGSPFPETDDRTARAGRFIEVGWGTSETGPSSPGIEMPWGAVWQPTAWIYGSQRTEIRSRDDDGRSRPLGSHGERATRIDLIANVRWSGAAGRTGHSGANDYSLRANASRHFDHTQTDDLDGALMVLGFTRTLGIRRDNLYANGYWAEGDFRTLASGSRPSLGPIGLSFAGVGVEGNRSAMWPRPLDATGVAVGLQTFIAEDDVNWTVELGHRQDLDRDRAVIVDTSSTALATRVQYRFANRFLLQMDAYHAMLVSDPNRPRNGDSNAGSSAVRVELRVSF